MTEAALSEIEKDALKAVGAGALPAAVSKALKQSPSESAAFMGKLQSAGLVTYNLTTGYTLTPQGTKLMEAKVVSKVVAEGGTFAHRSVGSRMPAQIQIPDAAAASEKKIEKMKAYAEQRARTRARLKQLAQEMIGQRRPLRTLGD